MNIKKRQKYNSSNPSMCADCYGNNPFQQNEGLLSFNAMFKKKCNNCEPKCTEFPSPGKGKCCEDPPHSGIFVEGCIEGDGTHCNPLRLKEDCLIPSSTGTCFVTDFDSCEYKADNIILCSDSEKTIIYNIPDTIFTFSGETLRFNVSIVDGDFEEDSFLSVSFIPPSVTNLQILSAVMESYFENDYFILELNENSLVFTTKKCFDVFGIGLSHSSDNFSDITPNLADTIEISSNSEIQIIDINSEQGTSYLGAIFNPSSSFQIFQNNNWVTISSDELTNNEYITSEEFSLWRIINSQEEILLSGEPSITCTTKEDTPCNILQDHETRINELENNNCLYAKEQFCDYKANIIYSNLDRSFSMELVEQRQTFNVNNFRFTAAGLPIALYRPEGTTTFINVTREQLLTGITNSLTPIGQQYFDVIRVGDKITFQQKALIPLNKTHITGVIYSTSPNPDLFDTAGVIFSNVSGKAFWIKYTRPSDNLEYIYNNPLQETFTQYGIHDWQQLNPLNGTNNPFIRSLRKSRFFVSRYSDICGNVEWVDKTLDVEMGYWEENNLPKLKGNLLNWYNWKVQYNTEEPDYGTPEIIIVLPLEPQELQIGQTTFECTPLEYEEKTICEILNLHNNNIEILEEKVVALEITKCTNSCNCTNPDGYVPYIGATEDIDLGNQKLKADAIDFEEVPANAPAERRLTWNDTEGTLDLGMKGGNVTQQIGMEQYIRAKSSTDGGIQEGYIYYLTGASGGNKLVALAQSNSNLTSKSTIGVATETTSGGDKAFITTFGLVKGLPDALFTGINEGDTLYLSSSTPGRFQNTAPTSPNHRIRIGYCTRKQSNNNEIFVSVQLGLDLNELCDVRTPTPSNGDYLRYNSSTLRWENAVLPNLDPIVLYHGEASFTGSTDENILQSFLITPSSWSTSGAYFLQILGRLVAGTTNTGTIKIYINTANNLSGAVLLREFLITSNSTYTAEGGYAWGISKHLWKNGNNLRFDAGTQIATMQSESYNDIGSLNVNRAKIVKNITRDFTVNQFLIVTSTNPSTGSTTVLSNLLFKKQ